MPMKTNGAEIARADASRGAVLSAVGHQFRLGWTMFGKYSSRALGGMLLVLSIGMPVSA